jgi:hypothetical protein
MVDLDRREEKEKDGLFQFPRHHREISGVGDATVCDVNNLSGVNKLDRLTEGNEIVEVPRH